MRSNFTQWYWLLKALDAVCASLLCLSALREARVESNNQRASRRMLNAFHAAQYGLTAYRYTLRP